MKKRAPIKIYFFPIFFLFVFGFNSGLFAIEGSVNKEFRDSLEIEIDKAAVLLSSAPEAFVKKALEIEKAAITEGDSVSYNKIYLYHGVYHAIKGNLDNAIRIFFEVWEFAFITKNPRLQVSAYNNIAGVYRYSGNYAKAEEYMLKGLVIWEDNQQWDLDRGQLLLSLGMVVDVQGRLDEADEYLHQALDIFKKEQDYDLMLQTMGELAFVMEKNGQNAKAMSVYNSMLPLYKYNNDKRNLATTNQRMGGVSMNMGLYSQAYTQLKYSLRLSDSLGYNVQKDSTLVRLIKASAHLGKLSELENYVNQLSRFHHEQETKNLERTIADLETSHQLNEQKLENDILRAETKNQKLEILNFRYLIGGSIGFLAILVILFITVYRYNAKIRKYSEELTKANAELEQHVAAKTELLDSRNLQLIQASFALAHEIRAKVSTILGAAELLKLEKGEEGTNQLLIAVKESTEELDIVVRDLISRLEE